MEDETNFLKSCVFNIQHKLTFPQRYTKFASGSYNGNITPLEVSSSTMTMGSSRCPGARNEYCLSLCLVKPVVKTRPFLR